MPPQQSKSPQQDGTTENAELDHPRHIEVCARVRPLTVSKASSNSFFEKHSKSSPRKPGIPQRGRPTGLAVPRKIGSGTTKPKTTETVNTTYAWDCFGKDTASQSPETDRVPGRTHSYTLDRVYGPTEETAALYDRSVQPLVHAAMDGYHASVLAYGQTSTGKTHTMSGTATNPGLIPLSVRECFAYLQRQDSPREYLLRVSYLEVYKEHVRDLLATSAAAPPVRLFEGNGELIIRGLREEVVVSPEQVFGLLAQGEGRRQVGATHANLHSSRSHCIVRLWIESRNAAGGNVRVSSLSLVDLAGSESVRLTGSSDRRQEGHYINQSLMTLGKVVYALTDDSAKKQHIPYRDSKLTRLLQPSLSGNAQVVMVCCISPLASHIEESHNTFKFATRAKKIPQKATVNVAVDDKTLLQSYREEIEDLKLQLQEAKDQQATLQNSNVNTSTTAAVAEDTEDEIAELIDAIGAMEKLILKSSPACIVKPEDLLDQSEREIFAGNDEEDLIALASSDAPVTPARPAQSPSRSAGLGKDLHKELNRVQGLLGSVIKKRQMGAAMPKPSHADEEVRNLRAQLEQQEVTTSLRMADSTFLQKQLEEKDNLLAEVSKILEALEQRQTQLEAENKMLRDEVARLNGPS